jgi:hypothetical protein
LLGFNVPFRPAMLIALAGAVWAGAAVVLTRAHHGRAGFLGHLTQAAAAVLTAAVLLRALLGIWWLFTPGSLPGTSGSRLDG